MHPLLDPIPVPALLPLIIVITLAAVEFGRWLGRRAVEKGVEPDGPVGAAVGATLGLLAFVLAFTFSMAASRFDVRKHLVVDEANAIGTTFLRTSFLPDPDASLLRDDLRAYVDARLRASADPSDLDQMIALSEQLQNSMWSRAAGLAAREPTFTTTPLFIQALNELIDTHGLRVAAIRNRIPNTIWMFVLLTTVIAMVAIGYQAGLSGARRRAAMVCLATAFAAIIMLVSDLERPQQEFLRVSQQSMLDLQRSMQAAPSAPRDPP